MWDHRPIGYPSDVPFIDPNNGQRIDGLSVKPKKGVLEEMFRYLKELYQNQVNFYLHIRKFTQCDADYIRAASTVKTIQTLLLRVT